MNTMNLLRLLLVTSIMMLLTACGGGGVSTADTTAPTISDSPTNGAIGGGGVSTADTTAPTVIVSPANGAIGVERNALITATFNEDMFAVTVDGTSFSLSDGSNVPGAVSFDALTNIATFTPTNNLAVLRSYTGSLTGSNTDLSGNALAALDWSFTTRDGVWGTATLIETDVGVAGSPQVAVDGSGNALAVWYQFDGTRNNIWANRYIAGTGWGTATLIETYAGNATSPQVAVDGSGNALAVWRQYDGTQFSIWANRYTAGTGWGTATLIETDAGFAGSPQVAVDGSGNALAVWSQSDGTRDNIWANRFE